MSLASNGNGFVAAIVNVSQLPWKYLIGSAAAVTALSLLSNHLAGLCMHENAAPLPTGPPATWFWEDPMPKKHIAHGLATLIKQHGPVISFRRGSHVTIVIGRMNAAAEIMEKEGGAFSDRPHIISAADILSGGMRILFEPAGDRFRRLRRAAHAPLQSKVAQTYEEIQAKTAKEVVLDVLDDPERYLRHVQRYAASVVLRLMYGETTPTSSDDPVVVRIHQMLSNFQKALRPGAYLVDRVPWLKYVPGYGRELKEFHRYELALFRDLLNRVRDDMATNRASPSFCRRLLEHTDDHRLSDDEMAYLSGTLLGAGIDTTASSILVLIMAAACHPCAQARVHEELDDVIGRDRVPTFGDLDLLPQLHAFMLEALRWRPIAPLGFAHRATKDVIWKGQRIPAGATVIGCHWAISRDPVAFPDPDTFNPRRWLTEDGRLKTDMHFYSYGFGRRVCPGQHVANRSLYINLALLLWSFRVLERPDAPIDSGEHGFKDGLVFNPEPFAVEFVPRMEEGRLRKMLS